MAFPGLKYYIMILHNYIKEGVKMDNKERFEKIIKSRQKQYKRQNEFIKENYDRITTTFPKGTKERIKNAGFPSVNAFINSVVASALEQLENME